ncbi:MAG: Flp family type IVb pilin [Gammaproteobacteria bacterium]|nr:Flp family type IVb pilin [Gammaproteobacteria bacterium]MCP5135557.1 Flp family type IVb pilin [Gammaproteobacteria bacterium]
MNMIARFLIDQRGTTAVEYSAIVAVLSVIAIAAYRLIGGSLGSMVSATASSIVGG